MFNFDHLAKNGNYYIYNNLPLTVENYQKYSTEEQWKIVEHVAGIIKDNGFMYPQYTDRELSNNFQSLSHKSAKLALDSNDSTVLTNSASVGHTLIKHFSPQFWDVKNGKENKPSVAEAFRDHDKTKAIIANRMGLTRNPNKKGEIEKYDLTCGNLITGASNSKIAVRASFFNALNAKLMWETFSQPNDLVFDYSMGFGQRLLGAISIKHPLTYIGADPSEKMFNSNTNIFNFCKDNIALFDKNKKIDLFLGGSEDIDAKKYEKQVSVAFSSPPYFNLEVYEDEATQAYHDNNYKYFIETWWQKVVNNIDVMLKPNGTFLLNVCDKVNENYLGNDMLQIAKRFGWEVQSIYKIALGKGFHNRKKSGEMKYEPIYVLKKI